MENKAWAKEEIYLRIREKRYGLKFSEVVEVLMLLKDLHSSELSLALVV